MNNILKRKEDQRVVANDESKEDTKDTPVGVEPGFNIKTPFENFFGKNTDFLKFSKKFQITGWETIVKNPYKNQEKFKLIIEKYLQKMLEVYYNYEAIMIYIDLFISLKCISFQLEDLKENKNDLRMVNLIKNMFKLIKKHYNIDIEYDINEHKQENKEILKVQYKKLLFCVCSRW